MSFEAFFLLADSAAGGQRFCLFHPPRHGPARGAIVYVHPLAEEMNKSRRMAALQSRAFAQAGYAVMQIDLLGCGDSSGDFGDATWQAWVDDVVHACRWVQARAANAPLWLWGLRAGCLVAVAAAARLDKASQLLLWQPATSGKLVLHQLLRLKLAADMLGGQAKGAMQALQSQLAAGQAVEVAGYSISPELAFGLERATLLPCKRVRRLEWIELSTRTVAELSPTSTAVVTQWQAAGCVVNSRTVAGPTFWQASEIEEAPALLAATVAAVEDAVAV